MQEEARSNAVNLVDDENTPPANTTGQHTGKKPRKKLPMPSNWPGPLSFLAWRKFGRLGDAHEYICSDKGDGPRLRYNENSAPGEPRSIVKVEGENSESLTSFPVNGSPALANNKRGKSRKTIRQASVAAKRHEKSNTDDEEDTQEEFRRLLVSLQYDIQVHNALNLYKILLKQAKELARIQPTEENIRNYCHLLSNPPPLSAPPAGDALSETNEGKQKQPEPE
jgi:hypothetical protein